MLDVGCGNARDLLKLGKSARCIGMDFSWEMLLEGKRSLNRYGIKASLVRCDALRLSFGDDVFDKVVCSEVIEHIPAWEETIREMRRVLRRDGLLVITTPNKLSMYKAEQLTVYALFVFLRNLILSLGKIFLPGSVFFSTREKRSYRISPNNPYDEWKTEKTVRIALESCGFKFVRSLGSNYLPGFFVIRRLPHRLQRMVVSTVSVFEPLLRVVFHRFGGGVALCARKV